MSKMPSNPPINDFVNTVTIQGFWNKAVDKYFRKVQKGQVQVTYPNGAKRVYGEDLHTKTSIIFYKNNAFKRIALYGDIGFAEAYMDGDFDIEDLSAFIYIALLNAKALETTSDQSKAISLYNLIPYLNRIRHKMRKNSKTKARKNISDHYDLSNDFFKLMLDDTMMYSSAVFENPSQSLENAQRHKLALLAQKLGVKAGDQVLEIGSGWGSMAIYLAKELDCRVTTLTLSKEQKALCEQRFKAHGVEDKITILLKDYRDMQDKQFDGVIAVEMFEAVGREYFDVFFKQCQNLLKPTGKLVLQVITIPDQRYKAYRNDTDFIQKYIFPGGHLPSIQELLSVTNKNTRLNLLHLEDFTEHYAKTLSIWQKTFNAKLEAIKGLGFDDYFVRMWNMYLSYCEAGFFSRNINLVQVVFTRDQNIGLNTGLHHV